MATIQPYGAFVNLGSDLNGLLHISQISHDRISSVEQVLEVGQKLKVSIPLSLVSMILTCPWPSLPCRS